MGHLLGLVEEELDDVVPALGVVEEHEQGPVDEPGPLLEGLEWGAHRLGERTYTHRIRGCRVADGTLGGSGAAI